MPSHRSKKRTLESGIEMDMTPMIDIVFLLIAFFMIVSDLSNLNIQHVILPEADAAIVHELQAGERSVTINVVLKNPETGEAGVRFMGDEKDLQVKELTEILLAEAAAYGKYIPNPKVPGQKDSMLQVLVRCDEGANSGAVHKVFKACQDAKIYRVRMGALSERAENPYLSDGG